MLTIASASQKQIFSVLLYWKEKILRYGAQVKQSFLLGTQAINKMSAELVFVNYVSSTPPLDNADRVLNCLFL